MDIFVCTAFYSNSRSPKVLGPVSCPAEIHCTTFFALRNGKFSRLGAEPPPYPLLNLKGGSPITKETNFGSPMGPIHCE